MNPPVQKMWLGGIIRFMSRITARRLEQTAYTLYHFPISKKFHILIPDAAGRISGRKPGTQFPGRKNSPSDMTFEPCAPRKIGFAWMRTVSGFTSRNSVCVTKSDGMSTK